MILLNISLPSSNVTSTTSIATNDYDFIRFKIKLWQVSHGYIMFIMIVLGILGNVLSFIIFMRKSVRKSTVSVYLRALAVADTCVLLTAFFRYKTYNLFLTEDKDVNLELNFSPYVQVYFEPFHWIALGMSSLVTLVLTIERFLAVKYPLSIKTACGKSLVRVCIVTIFFSVVLLTLPLFFSYKVVKVTIASVTVHFVILTKMGSNTLYPCMYHIYVLPFVWYIIPWFILAILNTALYYHVKKSAKIQPSIPKVSNPNRHLSLLIICIVLVYMICNLPSCIMVFYKLAHHKAHNKACIQETTGITFQTSRLFLVIEAITELLNIFNSCMNFVVYCLMGTKFRRELKKMFACLSVRKNNKTCPTIGNFSNMGQSTRENMYSATTF